MKVGSIRIMKTTGAVNNVSKLSYQQTDRGFF